MPLHLREGRFADHLFAVEMTIWSIMVAGLYART